MVLALEVVDVVVVCPEWFVVVGGGCVDAGGKSSKQKKSQTDMTNI